MNQLKKPNDITEAVIGAAIEVYRTLGPGLLESAYEACLAFELAHLGFKIERQVELPVVYKNVRLDCGYRLDLVVDSLVIVEVKAVESIHPIHEAQLLSYLKLSGLTVGLLLNFHSKMMKQGIRRIVNHFSDSAVSAISAVSGA